ncbi:uncharacterized protein METZ01_LOCUS495555, partial [marine metagenome]
QARKQSLSIEPKQQLGISCNYY